MCVMAYIPSHKDIPKDTMKKMWDRNSDGGGYMFAHDDNIITKKGWFDFEEYYTEYKADREQYQESDFVVHMRISTGGKLDKKNCHPHIVNDDWAFAHNGVIQHYPKSEQDEVSDTVLFNNHIMKGLPEGWWDNDSILSMIEVYIGQSKLIYMHRSGYVDIANEDKGTWEDGIWYSNTLFKTPKTVGKYTNSTTRQWVNGSYQEWDDVNKVYFPIEWSIEDRCYVRSKETKAITKNVFSEVKYDSNVNIKTDTDEEPTLFNCSSCGYMIDVRERSSYKGLDNTSDMCIDCAMEFAKLNWLLLDDDDYDVIENEYYDYADTSALTIYEEKEDDLNNEVIYNEDNVAWGFV